MSVVWWRGSTPPVWFNLKNKSKKYNQTNDLAITDNRLELSLVLNTNFVKSFSTFNFIKNFNGKI